MTSLADEGMPAFDLEHLYRQESFTDLHLGTIQRLTPVTPDGEPDPARETLFSASSTVMTAAGALPVSCDIEAKTLREAAEKMPDAIEAALKDMIQRAQEYQRERAGGIVVPPPGTRLEMP